MVQWLRLHVSTAKGTGSVPGQEIKTSNAVWFSQKQPQKLLVSKIHFRLYILNFSIYLVDDTKLLFPLKFLFF